MNILVLIKNRSSDFFPLKNTGRNYYIFFFLFFLTLLLPNTVLSNDIQKISGIVIDEFSLQPIQGVNVLFVEKNINTKTDSSGYFEFIVSIKKNFTLEFTFSSYRSKSIKISNDSIISLIIKLTPISYTTPVITVTDSKDDSKFNELMKESGVLKDKELQKDLSSTLAATLKNETGLSVRSMGPAPSRPVFRGMTGDRILITEDGSKTNDLSATSPDHAVTIEPFSIDKIEVLRGPKVLLKSTSTFGGIVNVIRNDIPNKLPTFFTFQTGFFGETSNKGILGSFNGELPIYNFVIRGEITGRKADNLKTPIGTLLNSDLKTKNYSASFGYILKKGFLGCAYREFTSDYGIPGGFIGAHPKGVDITMLKKQFKFKAEYNINTSYIKNIEFEFVRDKYNHKEFEASGLIGAEFGLINYNSDIIINHKKLGFIDNGSWGFSSDYRDFKIGGYVFTSPTKSVKISAFFYENINFNDNKTNIELSGRINYDNLKPNPLNPNSSIGLITQRSFTTFSLALSAIQDLSKNYHFGISLSRSSRVPTIEELYSEGPHLAAYSYEIGNPYLESEYGYGGEIFLHYKKENMYFLISFFGNDIPYYIIPRNNGDTNYSTLLPIYKTDGVDAVMFGFESQFEYNFWKHLTFSANLSYTNGSFKNDRKSLPAIPPLKSIFEILYKRENFIFGISTELVAAQNRVDEFENPTKGYGVINSYSQYSLITGNFIHSLSVNFENIFNKEYRNHLSRVKSIMPESGRNLRITYKMFF